MKLLTLAAAGIALAACTPAPQICERTVGMSKEGIPIMLGEPCVISPRAAAQHIDWPHDDNDNDDNDNDNDNDNDPRTPPVVEPPVVEPPVVEPPVVEPPKNDKPKCNSGRGNGSEIDDGGNDCDPGNSGDVNQGGD